MIKKERIRSLNQKRTSSGSYVLYWMQASQRAECNHALEYAVSAANDLQKPVVVYFGITDDYPEANERHYCFMLQGLREARATLLDKGIQMVIGHEPPQTGVLQLARNASLVVVDTGYLKIQRRWRRDVASSIDCRLVEVESDAVIPVREASEKEEYSAATIRPKLRARLPYYLTPLREQKPKLSSVHMNFEYFDIEDIDKALSSLRINRSVKPVMNWRGGTSEARKRLETFIEQKLDRYSELRNDPNADCVSHMSPYLHFGQISPLYIALRILETDSDSKAAYLEELLVRRELSLNFVLYNEHYDSFQGLSEWARRTLLEHKDDLRNYTYGMQELENASTHDGYWNAAQIEMTQTGKMHGYMRMYWGKKILEWSPTPEDAFDIALYLNNKYELDGRDPNGFAGVAWCFGKHDRPWFERSIFGKVRYMSSKGLERKFDADAYAKKFNG